jgi:hypothetical protein
VSPTNSSGNTIQNVNIANTKTPPSDAFLKQLNSVYTLTTCLFKYILIVSSYLDFLVAVFKCVFPLKFHMHVLFLSSDLNIRLRVTHLSRNSPPFMEPESSLPCSEQPATGLFPESDESSLHSETPFKIRFNIILPSRSLSGLILSSFPTEILYAFLISHTCYMFAYLILFYMITLIIFYEG